MMQKIKTVRTKEDCILSVVFQNGVIKEYDLKKIFSAFPQFELLAKDEMLYRLVRVDTGGYGLSWNDDLDLDAEEIWENGVEVGTIKDVELIDTVAIKLMEARSKAGMTQKQLAEATGIYQADISKIERGLANPSLSTLQRLADGLGMKLSFDFLKKDRL